MSPNGRGKKTNKGRMTREEAIEASWEYAQKASDNPCTKSVDDCELCWVYRSDMPCPIREKAAAFIAGVNYTLVKKKSF